MSLMRCTQCVLPTSRPDTFFDETGVCSACRTYPKRLEIDWVKRRQELLDLLERHKGKREFDCIVPSSGGKDSHWQVLTLIELGAKPLVVTATTCQLTHIGRRNIDNLASYATTLEVSPNKIVRAKLNRIALEMVGDISWSEHVSIFTTPFKIASRMGIPLIFYGESPQNQYGGPPGTEEARIMTRRWVSEFGGFLGLRPQDLIGMEGITERDMQDYMPGEIDPNIEAHFLGQYLGWDSDRNAEVAAKAGMEQAAPMPGQWPAENLDNAQTGIHDHMMYRKYGYGRLAAQLSVDIRKGKISREEAMLRAEMDDGLFPFIYAVVHYSDVLKQIDITDNRLMEIMDQFTDWSLFTGKPDNFSRRPKLRVGYQDHSDVAEARS